MEADVYSPTYVLASLENKEYSGVKSEKNIKVFYILNKECMRY